VSGIELVPFLIQFAVLLFSLTVHESAHAWTADRLGDPTARRLGRISMNPAVHVDPIGTLLLPLVAFATGAPLIGWAKPVPVNINNLPRHRRDFLVVAAAGPASNLLIALAASIALRLAFAGVDRSALVSFPGPIAMVAAMALSLNLLLAVFNMLPIPPLDGGNVLAGLLPDVGARLIDGLRPYGFLLLYGLMFTGMLGAFIDPPYAFLMRLLSP
jgi:Zn-dependent protease